MSCRRNLLVGGYWSLPEPFFRFTKDSLPATLLAGPAHLLALGWKRVHAAPSQAQYGSRARQHSEQARPWAAQRYNGIWATALREATYSWC